MTGIVRFEDGSDLAMPSLGYSATLSLIAQAAELTHPKLARWLDDVSQRSNPFMDFDLADLATSDRQAFWIAVTAAAESVRGWDQETNWSGGVEMVRHLDSVRETMSGINPAPSDYPIDLDDLWFWDSGEPAAL